MNPLELIRTPTCFDDPIGTDPLYSARPKPAPESARGHDLDLTPREGVPAAHDSKELVGASPAFTKLMAILGCVARTDSAVLLTGETGTGKELIARAIHILSGRRTKPLVTLDCTTLPAGLAESELFGHEKGAFTGALSRRLGRFELADGGTLFLDEIGDLPLDLQAKLLRILQAGDFERVGGSRTLSVNVRTIAATHRDLAELCRQGRFRPDLFYRLQVFPIAVPPLRDRQEDIPLLVRHFTQAYSAKLGKRIATIPERMMGVLCRYAWPGNIRELQHLIERAVILTRGTELALAEGFQTFTANPEPSPLATLEEVERAHILKVLDATGWRISGKRGAAQLLGLPPTTLRSRMEKLGITKHPVRVTASRNAYDMS
ncbi:MAG: sigma-54 interaction domain-containing protein [Gammaproteobacteria bacterium]